MTERSEGRSIEERANALLQQEVVDLSSESFFSNGQELWDLIFYLQITKGDGPARLPIIGTDTSVYMLFTTGTSSHLALWEKLGKPQNVTFTSSIEGFQRDHPRVKSALELATTINGQPQTIYLPLGKGSDHTAMVSGTEDHPLKATFNQQGKEVLKSIFEKEGLTLV